MFRQIHHRSFYGRPKATKKESNCANNKFETKFKKKNRKFNDRSVNLAISGILGNENEAK